MVTRFTDDLFNNTDGSDFIVRKHGPLAIQMLVLFTVAFLTIYLTSLLVVENSGRWIFIATLTLILGSLSWFTTFFISRNRDLTLATEFQNAMLASATRLSTRFCLICKRDGSIVYIDPGFQSLFPEFLHFGSRTIDGLLASAGIDFAHSQEVTSFLERNENGHIILDFRDTDQTVRPFMVTIDVLPRPRGYFLFRGRDFVERGLSAPASETATAALLAHTLGVLPEGILITDRNGNVTYVNRILEEALGYEPGEMQGRSLTLAHIIRDCAGEPGPHPGNYEGVATLLTRDQVSLHVSIRQIEHTGDGQARGLSIIVQPLEDDQPHPSTAAGDSAPQLSQFIASSPLAIARLDLSGTVLEYNQSLPELVKSPLPDAGWQFADIIHEENRAEVTARIERIASGKPADKKTLEIALGPTGSITASLYLSRTHRNAPEIFAQLIDTTEQKNLEQRFAHSQKMQAVGQLAGGVAHDFNNLLTAMIGFCDLLLMRHPAGDQSFADIMQVKQNANRAANLVRQLLAFSRRQTLQPKMLDITDVLAELSNLMRRLIGENIELKVVHGRDLGMVKADQGQLEQVFINLAVNARDAMQNGGRLTICTSHVTIDPGHSIAPDLVPPVEDEAIVDGDYVLVEVIDTGSGIPRGLIQKIFEPFFSTKEVGSGTGLGLATVYGIIKQTGGYIYVKSREGVGTTFSLFLRRYQAEEAKPVPEAVERPTSDDLTGKGTVLLVEDETPVRTFAARALRNKGYTVLEADCGETAIEVMEKQGEEVDVIITDVIMPGINGPDMIETVAPKFPRVKVVFISGYAEDIFVKSYGSEREFNFLPKPFTLKQLASKVKEVLS